LQALRINGICVLFFSLIAMNNAFSSDRQPYSKVENAHLTIASSNNFPPINVLDDNGELTGFARDLVDAVALELDLKVSHIHSDQWGEVLAWLDTGKADLIHDTGFTPERERYLDFTLPIIEMNESIFVRDKQFNILDFGALAGKKVACVNNHITHIYLKKFEDINCYLVNTPAEGLVALINAHVDAFIYPEQITLYLAQDLGLEQRIKVVGKPLRKLSWSMSVKKGNLELVSLLNHGIKTVKDNGEYQQIYDKWFGRHFLSGYSETEVYFISLGSVLFSLLIVITLSFLLYSFKMRRLNDVLEASEKKYRTLADNLPESIFLKDLDSVYVSCNKRFADNLSIAPQDIVGKKDEDFFPDNAALYRQGDLKIIASGETAEFVEPFTTADGKKGYINTVKTPVYNEQNEMTGVLGFYWDITEQYALQKQLATTINDYNAIMATVPDAMYKLDKEGNFIWWNKTFEKITGKSVKQIRALNALDVIVEEDRQAVAIAIKQAMLDGYAEVEASFMTASGQKPYYFNGARLLDDDGQLAAIVGSGRDMSGQKEAEKQQKILQTQLLQAQKMESIGQLTGGIAHDFNNMLVGVLGYGELAQKRLKALQTDEKLAKYLNEIVKAGERARDLVAQMLTFARVHKGEVRPVDINAAIDELVNMLRPVIPATITLHKQSSEPLPLVLIDPVMTQQMLVNLCINARDAMGDHGTITVSASLVDAEEQICSSCHHHFAGEYILIAITDSGEGIDQTLMDKIFEPFMTTKSVGKGTGMGLAMVHGISHEHGGHLAVSSKPGCTAFNLYLPAELIVASNDDIDEPELVLEPDIKAAGSRILVVDDEKGVARLLNEVLSMHGFEVTIETDSQNALERFNNKPDYFDLIITDQTMPGLTGKELSIKLLEVRPDLPIIMCTGFSEKIDIKVAKQIGIRDFLNKPVNNNVLLAAVNKALDSDADSI